MAEDCPTPEEIPTGAGVAPCEPAVPAEPLCTPIENCVDDEGNPVPLTVDIGEASVTIDGEVNIEPDGPVSAPICVDGVAGVVMGQCDDGVASWKAHDLGGGVVAGPPPAGFTFGACPLPEPEEPKNCTLETWCRRTDTIEVDNHTIGEPKPLGLGLVAVPADDQVWELELSNGQIFTYNYTGWDGSQASPATPTAWAYINAQISTALAQASGKPVKLNGSGRAYGVRGGDGDPNTAYGAFGWVDCCPGEVSTVQFKTTVVGGKRDGRIIYLPVRAVPGQVEEFTKCVCCGEAPVWYSEGKEVEAPEDCLFSGCVFPEAATQPPTPEDACTAGDTLQVCEITPGDDSDPDNPIAPTLFQADIFLQFIFCGVDVQAETFTLDADGEQVEHTLGEGNYYGNCDTLLPVEEPPPACPDGLTFDTCVETGGWYGIIDNSLWDNAPLNHLQNGQGYTFDVEQADGTVTSVPLTADPYFPNFFAVMPTAFPGLTVKPVCANHSSPKGCNAGHVANLAQYPAYDPPTAPGDIQNNLANPALSELWATGWLLDAGDCVSPIVKFTISAANDAAWVGISKSVIVHEKPKTKLWVARTCDGVYYQDCEGNQVAAPECCPEPCATGGLSLESLICPCEDPCTNGSTFINGRPPASNAWTWGPYSAPNLNDFTAALTAAGYTVNQFGEKHQICPPFGAFGEDPDAGLFNGLPGEPFFPPVEPNIDPDFVPDNKDALCTKGCNDDRRDDKLDSLIETQQETNVLLAQLIECLCGPCGPKLDQRCFSYSHPLTSGYRNWSDAGDLNDLADEFGITPTAPELWVRVTEFDCGGTTQPQVGQIFGPYTPGPAGADQFITDLGAAIAGTCIGVATGPGSGPSGVGSNIIYSYDSTQDSTLVFQEGVTVGGGVAWFTSAQGIAVRSGQIGDFISSTGNGATTSYANETVKGLGQYTDAESCEAL